MRYYRGLQPDEILQAGDEALRDDDEWVPVLPAAINAARIAALYGMPPFRRSRVRRPVDLPVLQPVTPEAMAELKDQETPFILFRHKEEPAFRFERAEYSKLVSLWLNADGYEINPFDWQWFIVPSTIPEVQQ